MNEYELHKRKEPALAGNEFTFNTEADTVVALLLEAAHTQLNNGEVRGRNTATFPLHVTFVPVLESESVHECSN